jgi:hypothetical protein
MEGKQQFLVVIANNPTLRKFVIRLLFTAFKKAFLAIRK